MQIRRMTGKIIDQILDENARAAIARTKAIEDYNIMIGNLEDPADEGEEVESDE